MEIIAILILTAIIALISNLSKKKPKVEKKKVYERYTREQEETCEEYKNKQYAYSGEMGERALFLELIKLYESNKVLRNVYIKNGKGEYAETDAILITEKGVFAFESKNYSGWIFGNDKDEKWTQSFRRKKVRFYNPVMQNQSHIKAIKKELNCVKENIKVFSVIVFSNRSELKNITVSREYTYVIKIEQLTSLLKHFDKEPSILTSGEITQATTR